MILLGNIDFGNEYNNCLLQGDILDRTQKLFDRIWVQVEIVINFHKFLFGFVLLLGFLGVEEKDFLDMKGKLFLTKKVMGYSLSMSRDKIEVYK